MTILDTTKIKQRPVTDSMTPEQLKQYKQDLREAQRGNTCATFDYSSAWRGHSFFTTPKPMSDDLTYPPIKHKVQEAYPMPYNAHNKAELIRKCKSSIAKLEQQIEKIKTDKTLSVADKQRKIAKRMEIIDNYRLSIKQAQEYINYENQRNKEMLDKYMKTK